MEEATAATLWAIDMDGTGDLTICATRPKDRGCTTTVSSKNCTGRGVWRMSSCEQMLNFFKCDEKWYVRKYKVDFHIFHVCFGCLS